jgi:hypothetical protein
VLEVRALQIGQEETTGRSESKLYKAALGKQVNIEIEEAQDRARHCCKVCEPGRTTHSILQADPVKQSPAPIR